MKYSSSTIFFLLLIGLDFAFSAKYGCPPPEDITPCTCGENDFTCINIHHGDELRRVFKNSEDYSFNWVTIKDSTLQYIPHEIFDYSRVAILEIENVFMIKLFDEPTPSLDSVRTLNIKNSRFLNVLTWDNLQSFTLLWTLRITNISVRKIGDSFSRYVTKELRNIEFHETETEKIKPGVLSSFPNLEKIQFSNCRFTKLTRDMFPIPFNGKEFIFSGNKITSIPDDLFTQMPKFHTMDLRNNLIVHFQESAFRDKWMRVYLDENPLKCDCSMVWYLRKRDKKELQINGKCSNLNGKSLRKMTSSDFNC